MDVNNVLSNVLRVDTGNDEPATLCGKTRKNFFKDAGRLLKLADKTVGGYRWDEISTFAVVLVITATRVMDFKTIYPKFDGKDAKIKCVKLYKQATCFLKIL